MAQTMSSNPRRNPFAVALARSRATFACIGVYSGAINMLTLTGSLFMLQVYDRVLPSRSTQTLLALLVDRGLPVRRSGGSRGDTHPHADPRRPPAGRGSVGPGLPVGRVGRPVAANGERVDPIRDLDQIRQFVATPGPAALFDLPWTPLYLRDLLPVSSVAWLAHHGRRADRVGAGALGRTAQPRLVGKNCPDRRRCARASSTAPGATPKCWRR